MSKDDEPKSLEKSLRHISQNINVDRFMLMEYLGPVVDGCRAALNVSLDNAQDLNKMSEEDFDQHITSVQDSFGDLTICLKPSDSDDLFSVVFDRGKTTVFDECIEPDVVISADNDTLIAICDSDPKLSPHEVLGSGLKVPTSKEITMANIARKSLHLRTALKRGHILAEDDFIPLRPGTGILPNQMSKVCGKTLIKDLPAGSILLGEHFE